MPTQRHTILLASWRLVLAVALGAALLSAGVELAAPPRYTAGASLLVTRAEDRRFDTEDALAYDLPAIVSGEPFARELAAELGRRGRPLTPEQARAAIGATNQRRVVSITASAGDPAAAEAILEAAVGLVRARGLALWGDPAATPEDPGVNVVVLAGIPARAERANGLRQILLDAALRGVVGLGAGALLALGLHTLGKR
ncbi:MAG TPA: Wzz/FepE/Etk N-terminal domain-containing protein [Roseiflexaceae bacterium]|nr:Wzz/FepE/Etk N-terminal domain-containing protein [Roseiflexaceae bacterium]